MLQSGEINLLYADLSNKNPEAMKEIVAAYKHRLEDKVQGIERFRSWRLDMLSKLLDFDDDILILKTTLEMWLDDD